MLLKYLKKEKDRELVQLMSSFIILALDEFKIDHTFISSESDCNALVKVLCKRLKRPLRRGFHEGIRCYVDFKGHAEPGYPVLSLI